MRRIIFLLMASCFATSLFSQMDQLVVWKNESKPVFKISDIEKLQELAASMKMEIVFKEINGGAPEEITYTPVITFQNEFGRSIYYGRYLNISRLKNFIRTASLSHQKSTDNFKNDLLVWEDGRTKVTAPLKLTELKGTLPKKYEEASFITESKASIAKGMSNFKRVEKLNQAKTTRSFYFNLYPHVDEKCNMSIGAEIFSQYNCVSPILQKYDPPLVQGKWKDREKLFKKAGKLIEQNIFRIMSESLIGDAFQSVSNTVPVKSWEDLDLALPVGAKSNQNETSLLEVIPEKWIVDLPKDVNQPFCIFSFLAPLDTYAGEVKNMTGTFTLQEENQLKSATGNFEVQIENVTMGAADFDKEVQNKMLNKTNFPISTFSFEHFEIKDNEVLLGKPTEFLAKGHFTLLGRSIQLFVPGQVIPYHNENGEVRLQVNATFNLPLFENFRVEGPDGPSPAKDTLQFFMKFNLKPV